MLEVIIVDDEPPARKRMRQLLSELGSVRVAGDFANANDARAFLQNHRVDAMFLDIRMPGADGFSLLAQLEQPPAVVFVTAFSQFAVEAFEVEAVDYVLKPVTKQRLAETLQRLEANASDSAQPPPPLDLKDRICLRQPRSTVVLRIQSLVALRADGDFTRVLAEGHEELFLCHSLGKFAAQLPCPPFFRADRSLILNLQRVQELHEEERHRWEISLSGAKEPLLIGRTAGTRIKEVLSKS